jgi:hypothetical protein
MDGLSKRGTQGFGDRGLNHGGTEFTEKEK